MRRSLCLVFINSGLRSKESSLKGDLKLYRNAIQTFSNDTGAWPATLSDLAATATPASGLDSTGAVKTIAATDWKGPCIDTIVNDPVSTAAAFSYTVTSPNVGKIVSSAAGNGIDGTAYSGW